MPDAKTKAQTPAKPLISVVVPAFNEAENVENLAAEIDEALSSTPYAVSYTHLTLPTICSV